jgi:hypothetical protein
MAFTVASDHAQGAGSFGSLTEGMSRFGNEQGV